MHDPVLNRKMFRHAAQIKHNRIPKYQTGTGPEGLRIPGASFPKRNFMKDAMWLFGGGKIKTGIGMLAKGGKYAYQTYKGARAATKAAEAAGKGGTWKGTLPFTRTGKGPQSLYQMAQKPISKHMMKYPKTYGYGKAGIGGGFTYLSGKEAMESAREGKWGTAALDASLIPFGGAMTAKGIQLLSKGWKGKQTFLRSGNIKKGLTKTA